MGLFSLTLIFQLFVLLNPLASAPFLLQAFKQKVNVRAVAFKSVLTALIIAIIIVLAGEYLFKMFGINVGSLKVAGGIILLLLGISMVTPKKEDHDVSTADELITIIATPMLTGPGVISFISLAVIQVDSRISVLANVFVAFALVSAVFFTMALFIHKINMKVIDIVSRILGLFLTAVAIEMIAAGIGFFIQDWLAANMLAGTLA